VGDHSNRIQWTQYKGKRMGISDSPTALVGNTGFSKAVALANQFFRPDIYGEKPENVQPLRGWQPHCGGGEWQSGGLRQSTALP
jgi:hypothetical protein